MTQIHILLKQLQQWALLKAYENGNANQRASLQQQIIRLNQIYPGGLSQYHRRARKMLKDSADGVNPYETMQISNPKGTIISYGKIEEWLGYEERGLVQLQSTAFVLVAGGLGERLGYPGIKVSLPVQQLSLKTFLQYYIEHLISYGKVPLAIMTSDDTYSQTVKLLHDNKNYGMDDSLITIMKQEKIPAMTNNSGDFAFLETEDKLEIETKPHGHGDIHTLLYQHKLHEKWVVEGKKWIVVFQDTNPLAMRSIPLLLGVSQKQNWDFNTIAVERKPKEAVGAIVTLSSKQKPDSQLTVNVEYNLLQSLFKGNQPINQEGFSLFPGNTNCFVIKASTYLQTLNETQGKISEFINPKYSDETKTNFKSSTRLECLMQDYPKLLKNCKNVGFVSIPKDYCFTTVKNDLKSANIKINLGLPGESAGSCEADLYSNNRKLLSLCGAKIQNSEQVEAGGAKLFLYPMVMFTPRFASCLYQLKNKVKNIAISKQSSVLIDADIILEDVVIDGDFRLQKNTNNSIKVSSRPHHYRIIEKLDQNAPAWQQIRGYKITQ